MGCSFVRILLISAALALGACTTTTGTHGPRRIESVTVHAGTYATVNSFIFSNGRELLVLDVLRKPDEARRLVERIRAIGLPVKYVLISHGHTDHFTGMAVVREAFPDARLVVANEDIKRAIRAYADYMDRGGATEGEPALDRSIKPKTPEYPNGFDYERNIEVLNSNRIELPSGGVLELQTDYLPTEADYMTTVYSHDLNALFLADLGYNRVHHWLGDDISWQDIANWQHELLRLKRQYAERNPKIYPGHGEPTDMSLFDASHRYLEDYVRVCRSATSRAEAMRRMIELYPGYGEANFFLKYSVENHVKAN